MRVEHSVERRIAEQNHLDVNVDGLWLEHWACPPRREFGGNDLQTTGTQRAHEHLPGARFREDVTGLKDEETAVGMQERPRVDHQMIGMDHASSQKLPLDETQQVRHGWRTLDDHRAGLVRGVGENDIDAVETGKRRVLRQGGRRRVATSSMRSARKRPTVGWGNPSIIPRTWPWRIRRASCS